MCNNSLKNFTLLNLITKHLLNNCFNNCFALSKISYTLLWGQSCVAVYKIPFFLPDWNFHLKKLMKNLAVAHILRRDANISLFSWIRKTNS